MVRIREAIVVEGRYDKNTLSQIVDAEILETHGFGIFRDKARLLLLRRTAEKRGLIVFTDPDGAGLVIRNYLKSAIPPQYLKHAYIPDLPGKEKRKRTPGKEGKLGVEGMTPEIILNALLRAGATVEGQSPKDTEQRITKQDMMELGLSSGSGSSEKRRQLQRALGFPENLSAGGLLQALNLLLTRQELEDAVKELENTNG